MKYIVNMKLILNGDKLTLANTIYRQLLTVIKDHAQVIEATQETSFLELQECHHDESPPKSCIILKRVEK